MKTLEIKSSKNFINRELSWIEFNVRVLEEAQDINNPLMERLRFLAIVSSNFDEFFMVRVGALWDKIQAGITKKDISGMLPKQQLKKILKKSYEVIKEQYKTYNEEIIEELEENNIFFVKSSNISNKQKKIIDKYYRDTVYPVVTPIVAGKNRNFPLVSNKSLNIVFLLRNMKDNERRIGIIKIPNILGRAIEVPSEKEGSRHFILMEDIIGMYVEELFKGHEIIDKGLFRITRNADLESIEEETEDILETIAESIKRRKWGEVMRLEIEKGMSVKLIERLKYELEIQGTAVYEIKGPIDLTFLMKFSSFKGFENLRYKKNTPSLPEKLKDNTDIFQMISKADILLHHPYDPFNYIVKLIEEASEDKNVLAIKQTLYRVSGNSPIIKALEKAAENGKEVTVLVELKARFDEENNISWAKKLEKAGCHVIYGLQRLKTHCKMLLIVRKEEEGIKRYIHMSTGNYNDTTARLYTDLAVITCNIEIGEEISALFNMISGYTEVKPLNKVAAAPLNLREKLIELIKREAENAKQGKHGRIIVKLNSLVDKKIIEALYEASNDGVKIDLIVRGICCLRPNVERVSENITVRSIVGRYLEHSRIFYFYNSGVEDIYLSSADWMNRNMDRRVELMFPIDQCNLKNRIKDILSIYLNDNIKTRILDSNGEYHRYISDKREQINSQEYFFKEIRLKKVKGINEKNKFKPMKGHNIDV